MVVLIGKKIDLKSIIFHMDNKHAEVLLLL